MSSWCQVIFFFRYFSLKTLFKNFVILSVFSGTENTNPSSPWLGNFQNQCFIRTSINAFFTISNKATGSLIYDGTSNTGEYLPCGNSSLASYNNKIWQFLHCYNGYYAVQNYEISRVVYYDSGAIVSGYYDSQNVMYWRIISVGQDYFSLQNLENGSYLGHDGQNSFMNTYASYNSDNAQWKLNLLGKYGESCDMSPCEYDAFGLVCENNGKCLCEPGRK